LDLPWSVKVVELRYWTKKLGVTPEELKQTVEKVSAMVTDVRKALGK
jgi:hypothetical protein